MQPHKLAKTWKWHFLFKVGKNGDQAKSELKTFSFNFFKFSPWKQSGGFYWDILWVDSTMCYFLSADMSKWSSHTCLFFYVYKQQVHHLLKLEWSAPKPLLVVITWRGCFEPRFRVVFENICAPEAWLNIETSFYSFPSALISPLHYTPAARVNCRVKVNSQRRKAYNSLQSLQIFISEPPQFFFVVHLSSIFIQVN